MQILTSFSWLSTALELIIGCWRVSTVFLEDMDVFSWREWQSKCERMRMRGTEVTLWKLKIKLEREKVRWEIAPLWLMFNPVLLPWVSVPPDKTSVLLPPAFGLGQKSLTLKHLERLCYQVYTEQPMPRVKEQISSCVSKIITKYLREFSSKTISCMLHWAAADLSLTPNWVICKAYKSV